MNNWNKHEYQVGMRIKLIPGPIGTYDGTDSEYGVITALTFDGTTPTYAVTFDDGNAEPNLYPDECKGVTNE